MKPAALATAAAKRLAKCTSNQGPGIVACIFQLICKRRGASVCLLNYPAHARHPCQYIGTDNLLEVLIVMLCSGVNESALKL